MSDLHLFTPPPPPRVAPPGEFARHSDPPTSHAAADRVKAGAKELEDEIVRFVRVAGPVDAFTIASALTVTGRWAESTVRTAVSRCEKARRIYKVGEGVSPRGMRCALYSTRTELVDVRGGYL